MHDDDGQIDDRPAADDASGPPAPAAWPDLPETPPEEWEYARARRRRGRPDEPLHIRPLLIDAGVAMVERDGFAELSLAKCARRAGVSSGAPYSWFANAVEFRCAVIATYVESARSDALDVAGAGGDALDLLVAACRALVQRLGAVGIGLDVVFGPADTAVGRDLAWARGAWLREVLRLVHASLSCQCSGIVASCPAAVAAWSDVFAVCHGYIALAGRARSDAERAETADRAGFAVRLLLRDRVLETTVG
ncbi:TetR/AcrR family transcriptional regulator [Jatrophihabitans fulvus]